MSSKQADLEGAKRLMGALLRMAPKPHSDMKLGKSRGRVRRSPKKISNPLSNKEMPTKRGR